jgi:methyl-accepting chemotaxis protein
MISNSKLANKFTMLLSLVFIGAILFSGFALSKALEYTAENEINYRAQVLMQMINSVRNYTSNNVIKLLGPYEKTQEKFVPETVPSYAARQVFENLRTKPEYQNYLYKDATLNPTNLQDQADDFETSLIENFRKQPSLQTQSGFRSIFGEQLFYTARPFSIKNPQCLSCHTTPEMAPKSLVETYGTEHGFGWKLNEILGTQIIYVPASQVFENVRKNFSLFIGIFIGIFALVIILINYLLKRNVIQPIKPMAQLAQKMSTGTIDSDEAKEFEIKSLTGLVKRTDELGQLGRVFQKMVREVYEREQRLKQQVQELRIKIDETKMARQVDEISRSEYFQKLRQEAKNIRNQWSESNE